MLNSKSYARNGPQTIRNLDDESRSAERPELIEDDLRLMNQAEYQSTTLPF